MARAPSAAKNSAKNQPFAFCSLSYQRRKNLIRHQPPLGRQPEPALFQFQQSVAAELRNLITSEARRIRTISLDQLLQVDPSCQPQSQEVCFLASISVGHWSPYQRRATRVLLQRIGGRETHRI